MRVWLTVCCSVLVENENETDAFALDSLTRLVIHVLEVSQLDQSPMEETALNLLIVQAVSSLFSLFLCLPNSQDYV